MLSHPCFDLSNLAGEKAHVLEYDFSQYSSGPQLASSVSGSGSGPVVGFTETLGPALKLTIGANPGTAYYTGPTLGGNMVAGAIVDVEDISYLPGGGSPQWAIGFYTPTFTHYSELFRDPTGVALVTQNGSSGLREKRMCAKGDNKDVRYASAGMFMDFSNNTVTAHMGYSMLRTSTNMPVGQNLNFMIRALASASANNFSVYMRKVRLTLIP